MANSKNTKKKQSSKSNINFRQKWSLFGSPKRSALFFAIAFAIVGTVTLGINYAAVNTILRLQGQTLTGSGTIVADSDSKQGKVLKLKTATPAVSPFTLPETGSKLLARVRGDQCNGSPQLQLMIDGKQELLENVTSADWAMYTEPATISGGIHTMSAKLTNPYNNASCTRAIYIDVIYVEKKLLTVTTSPSGQAMPVGNLPGWTQVFTEDFETNAPLGSFNTVYGTEWRTYTGPDTAAKHGSTKKSEYNTPKVVSVSGGILDKYLHTEYDANGDNGAGNYMMSSALLPRIPGQLYGKYTVRIKADAVDGYKVAWLMWPDSGDWPKDGEIDFIETDLTESVKAFIHRQGATVGSDQTRFVSSPAVSLSSGWHTVSLEWAPTLKIYIDGVLEGQTSDRVPNTPMHLVLQTESELSSPTSTASGHLKLDWVAVYKRQ